MTKNSVRTGGAHIVFAVRTEMSEEKTPRTLARDVRSAKKTEIAEGRTYRKSRERVRPSGDDFRKFQEESGSTEAERTEPEVKRNEAKW